MSVSGGSPIGEEPSCLTASARRRIACERCFKRKQKCDKLLPACTSCSELGLRCKQRQWRFEAPTKEMGITHSSMRSYVESLQRKIGQLEHHLHGPSRRPSATSVNANSSSNGPVHDEVQRGGTSISPCPSSSLQQGDTMHNEDLSAQEAMGEIGLLSRSAMAESHGDSGKLPRNLNIDNMVMAALALDGPSPYQSTISDISELRRPALDGRPLDLNGDTIRNWMTRFLDDVGVQIPHLQRDELMRDYESVTNITQSHSRKLPSDLALPYFNTCLAVAIGALISPNAGSLGAFASNLHSSAIQQLPLILRDEDGQVMIHCILLLAIFSSFTPCGGSTWHLIGLAMKKCISLRLHEEPEALRRLPQETLRKGRQLFWSVYILDRSISLVMGRPFSIQDEDITVVVPGDVDLSGDKTEAALRKHLVIQARLASNIRTNSQEGPLFHHSNICFWRDLPSDVVSFCRMHQHIFDYLEQLAYRLLVQITPPISNNNDPNTGTFYGNEKDTLMSCQRFINRCYDRSTHNNFNGSFIDAYDIFSASVTFIYLSRHGAGLYQNETRSQGQETEIIHKSSTLVTIIAERFTIIKVFQRALLGILTETHDANARNELESMIPEQLYQLYRCCL